MIIIFLLPGRNMIKRITSKENLIIRRIKQLESKKFRDNLGLFVLEGLTMLKEALAENIRLEYVVYSDSFASSQGSLAIISNLQNMGLNIYSVDDKIFEMISGTETPQGILAAAEKPEWDDEFLRIPDSNVLVLDRVSDPGNMGTIIRTAEAAGFAGLIVLKGSADPYSGKVTRAAAGSLMRMPVIQAESPDDVVEILKENNKGIICTDPESKFYCYNADLTHDIAIVIGNEASGVSPELLENASVTIGIPMEGKTESLNAAMASGMLMYESLRQRKLKGRIW